MKLFIWEDVLTDWSPGLVVAIGNDLEDALAAIKEVDAVARGVLRATPSEVIELNSVTPPRKAWLVWGGG